MNINKSLVIGLAVLVSCFLTASSLKCYKCDGDDTAPLCNATEECGTAETQCISEVEKDDNGKVSYHRGCAPPLSCTSKKAACSVQKTFDQIEACTYECCDTDNCNSEFPMLGAGVKVTSGLVAILVTLSFTLFVM